MSSDRRMTSATQRRSPRRCNAAMKFVATNADQHLQALHRGRATDQSAHCHQQNSPLLGAAWPAAALLRID